MGWWIGAAGAMLVAVLAGVADWRRQRRDDLDAVGWIDWRTLHILALVATALCGALAWGG